MTATRRLTAILAAGPAHDWNAEHGAVPERDFHTWVDKYV
jgi:hypothetical protein